MKLTAEHERIIATLEWSDVATAAERVLGTITQEAVEARLREARTLRDEDYASAYIAELEDEQADAFLSALAAVSRERGEEDDADDADDIYREYE